MQQTHRAEEARDALQGQLTAGAAAAQQREDVLAAELDSAKADLNGRIVELQAKADGMAAELELRDSTASAEAAEWQRRAQAAEEGMQALREKVRRFYKYYCVSILNLIQALRERMGRFYWSKDWVSFGLVNPYYAGFA